MISIDRTAGPRADDTSDEASRRPSRSSGGGWLELRVVNSAGKQQAMEVAGSDRYAATRHAASRGLRVLSIRSVIPSGGSPSATLSGHRFRLVLFSQELLALLEAGLNVTEALQTLVAKERNAETRSLLALLLRNLREGRALSDVLAMWPRQFPPVYVASVRASERTGGLPEALGRYIVYESQFQAIRKKLSSAAIYPTLLLVVGGFVTLFLLGYVVPRFATVYESSGREMPWLSSVLLSFGKAIYQNWQLALVALLTAFASLAALASSSLSRTWLLTKLLSLPWLSAKANDFRLARFYRAVSLLLLAGIALPRALGMVTRLLGSTQQAALAKVRAGVDQGKSLSTSLVAAGLANPVAESLIKVGERSGQLAEMLERTARFQDEDFERWTDWLSRALEPVLMALIGVVVGGIVILMYMPIFDLAGSIQ